MRKTLRKRQSNTKSPSDLKDFRACKKKQKNTISPLTSQQWRGLT